jgi:hypothetical protein
MGLLVVHLVATAVMTGLIWFVQVVHYPLFARVGAEASVAYALEHQRRTSFVVGAPMAAEGVSALWILFAPPEDLSRVWPFVGLVLLGVVLGSTVLLQVPQHAALAVAYDEGRVRRLVATNWIRTFGWSARCAIAAGLVVAAS